MIRTSLLVTLVCAALLPVPAAASSGAQLLAQSRGRKPKPSRPAPPPSGEEESEIDLEPLTPVETPAEPKVEAPPAAPPPGPQGPACELSPHRALAEGPVSVGFFAADRATPRRACPRSEVGLQLGGDAEIDIPRYRALMGGGATVYGSYAPSKRLEVFAQFEAYRMTFAQGASLSTTVQGVGNLSGGATWVVWMNAQSVFSASARLQVPTSVAVINARTTALEAAGVFSHRFGAGLEIHGFAGADFAFAISPATALPRLGLLAGAGVQWTPLPRFALALDLQAHFLDRYGLPTEEGTEAPPIDYLAPALAARFAATDSLGLELALATHVIGHRSLAFSPGLRTESGLLLRAHYRF